MPIAPGWSAGTGTEPAYCCFGCRFAAEVTREKGERGRATWMLTRLGVAIFCTLNVVTFSMALWSDGFDNASSALSPTVAGLFRYLSQIFALPVLFLLGGPLLTNAWEMLRRGRLTTDLLLCAGVAASYLYSAVSVFRNEGPIYFEVGCVVLVLVTLGRWLEATARLKANESLEELERLLPATVRRRADTGLDVVPLERIVAGDVLQVSAGERIPCDGRVLSGAAQIDQQWLTGESLPVVREGGDDVVGGTLNLDGELAIRVTAAARSGAFGRLLEIVRAARETRGPYHDLADRLSAWFFPVIATVAVGAGAWHGIQHGVETGLMTGLAVVLIACPCPLGLAAPLATWTAISAAARAGVLFRNGEVLERLASVRVVRFDKTGTLTTGQPTVSNYIDGCAETLRLAASLSNASSHPFSQAILRFAGARGLEPVRDVRTLPGRGVRGLFSPDRGAPELAVWLGSRRLMDDAGLSIGPWVLWEIERAEAAGRPVSCVGWNGQVHGAFVFDEIPRPGAQECLRWFQNEGCDVAVLTGDHPQRGQALQCELGVPVHAGLIPEEKWRELSAARTRGPTAMVGDGINDAPALSAADVGIALGCGTDVSRDSAGVCLLSDDLMLLPWAVELSRRTVRTIRNNLLWAFGYNAVGVALAAAGVLNPAIAAGLMAVSSVWVLQNSLRFVAPPRVSQAPPPPPLPDQSRGAPGTSLMALSP